MSAEYIDRLKELVSQGEADVALEQVVGFLRGRSSDLLNEALVHQSQLRELRVRERRGRLSEAAARAERARLTYAILDFLDEVKERVTEGPTPRVVPGCDFELPVEMSLEKIFGANNLKSIAWLRRGLEVARSVGRIVTREALGTGFLIGDGMIMTNHHVIPDRQHAEGARMEFGFEEDLERRISPGHAYPIVPDSVVADEGLDVCVARITQPPGNPAVEEWGSVELDASAEPKPGEHVTIIQHPSGGPKQISITANQVVNVFEHRLQYVTDTLPGSSGSPVFDDKWKVVAIHHAGGNLRANASGQRIFANEGILVSHILDRLEL